MATKMIVTEKTACQLRPVFAGMTDYEKTQFARDLLEVGKRLGQTREDTLKHLEEIKALMGLPADAF